MTLQRKLIVLVCDQPNCRAGFEVESSNLHHARFEAAKEGWSVYHKLDFCPEHRQRRKQRA